MKPAEHQQWSTQSQILQDLPRQSPKHFPSQKPDHNPEPLKKQTQTHIEIPCGNPADMQQFNSPSCS